MDVNDQIHAQLVKAGVRLAASLPDDWVNTLIRRVAKDNQIRHVPVGREAETIAICAGAFFGGVRSVAIMGNTGLLTCTGEMATLCLRHMIPVFCIVSGRGSIDDHKVYQEVQGRRTIPLLQAYDYPYKVIDKPEEIERHPGCLRMAPAAEAAVRAVPDQEAARSEERMKANEAMKVLAKHRGDAVVVCALGMAANEWWAVTQSEDSFYMHGGMGLASTFALGLALSLPETPVWVINSDGGLCMNTGTLITEAGQQPRNMKHFVVDNQCYQTVETMPMVNQDGADYTMMARGAGFQRADHHRQSRRARAQDAGDRRGARALFHPPAHRGRARLSARAARDLRRPGDEIPLRPRDGEEARHQGVRPARVLMHTMPV